MPLIREAVKVFGYALLLTINTSVKVEKDQLDECRSKTDYKILSLQPWKLLNKKNHVTKFKSYYSPKKLELASKACILFKSAF